MLLSGLTIYSYPQYLYNHSINKKRVVIGGSHGKTTITAMVMHVLKYYNKNFDYLVGSQLKDFEVMVRLSDDAPVMIFEGDEYLSSPIDRRPKFHWYHPHIALLSGIAWDHINVFPSYAEYKNQFAKKDRGRYCLYLGELSFLSSSLLEMYPSSQNRLGIEAPINT